MIRPMLGTLAYRRHHRGDERRPRLPTFNGIVHDVIDLVDTLSIRIPELSHKMEMHQMDDYTKKTDDPRFWVIDPEAAGAVHLSSGVGGKRPMQIASALCAAGGSSPTSKGISKSGSKSTRAYQMETPRKGVNMSRLFQTVKAARTVRCRNCYSSC